MPGPDEYRAAAGYRRSSAADSPQLDPQTVADAVPSNPATPAPTGPTAMATRPYDAFAMGAAWLGYLAQNMDTILKKEGTGQDLRLYDALLDDDNAYAMFMQRRDALIARPWIVEPGNPDDPRSVEAADDLREMLEGIGWDHVTRLMFFTIWFGYGVAEAMYSVKPSPSRGGRAKVWLDQMIVPDRNWFAFSNGGELRLKSVDGQDGVQGAPLPPNKFWAFRTGGTHDFNYYGTGLAHWVYWPIWFKRNGLQFWALYLEKYGQPTAVGYFQPGAPQADIDKMVSVLTAIGRDSAVALPMPPSDPNSKTDYAPKLLEAQRSGGADSYEKFTRLMDEAVTRVIVGQTMTSRAAATGIGSNQSDTQADRLLELVKSDGDDMMGSFNKGVPVWLTLWNYGEGVAPPTVFRQMDDDESLDDIADRDSKIDKLGWTRTEESFKQVYGEGYEKKPEPKVDPLTGRPANDNRQPGAKPAKAIGFAAADPKPLYVKRDLANVAEVRRWATSQGIALVDDPHVTIIYSRTPVNWLEMGSGGWNQDDKGRVTVNPGGVRLVDYLGPKGAVVLHFVEDSFKWRHREMIELGASSDHDGYQAHVTLFYDPDRSFDVEAVEPYRGKLVFGPEYFEELETGELPAIPGLAFSAETVDRISALADLMATESEPIFLALAESIRDKLAAFSSDGLTPEELRIALLEAAERFPADQLGSALGKMLTAVHAGAATNRESDVEP